MLNPLFLTGALVVIGIPVSLVYLLIVTARLRQRIAALEAGLTLAQVPSASERQDVTVSDAVPDTRPPIDPVMRRKPPPLPRSAIAPAEQHSGPPKAIVLTALNLWRLSQWIAANWFYAVSATSLALAGVFLVIYGAEQGLMPPSVRILASLLLGCGLIGAGEYIRRRFGDDAGVSTAYLPSTLSGAGIVTLFGAILAARHLYGFIGPGVTLTGMAVVGLVAMVLGWFSGPLLAAVGILGAMAAPFVIGGSSDDPSLLLAYFAIVTIAGLGIDTVRRWGGVSILSLVTGFGAGYLLTALSGLVVVPFFMMFCGLLALAAIAIPVRSLTPDHQGTPISIAMLARHARDAWPEFPTRLAGGAVVAASVLITLAATDVMRDDLLQVAILVLSGLTLALLLWTRNAPALVDLAAAPAAALLVVVGSGNRPWGGGIEVAEASVAPAPLFYTLIVGLGLVLTLAAAWRSLRGGAGAVLMAAGAALMAPALAIVLEVSWHPAATLGAYAWALHAMVIAAVMVGLADRFARRDGPDDRLRMSFAILSALACIAFGMVILFSSAALTTALTVTVVTAAWLDRQFNLPLMAAYILVGVSAVGYRLVADPGVQWAIATTFPQMIFVYAGALAGFLGSWSLAVSSRRPRTEVLLESATFSTAGIMLSLLFYRTVALAIGDNNVGSHWAIGIGASIWIILGLAQLRRLTMGGAFRRIRMGLVTLFLGIGAIQLGVGVVILNPVLGDFGGLVHGPILINTLMPAYLLPGVALLAGAVWLRDMPRMLRLGFAGAGTGLVVLWAVLAIRHAWRGADLMATPGAGQGELYSYTLAILIVGAMLFYQSLARRSALLRKAGLAVIGLAVAKVFLVDIGELDGLTRVFSLLVLGFGLAGLAFLNRWAVGKDGGH